MRVLHIINTLGPGGAERLLLDIIPLMNKNYSVKIDLLLLSDKNNFFEKEIKQSGISVNIIPLNNPASFKNIFYIRKFIEGKNYDIIHAHLFPTLYWVSLVKKCFSNINSHLIFTEHNTINRRRKYKIFRIFDKLIYKEYDKIICISEKTRSEIMKWLKFKPEDNKKFIVLENSVDINRFKEALPYKKNELISRKANNLKLICMVGSFTRQKDQPTIIKSMLLMEENVHLILVGRGPTLNESRELANKLKLTERVHFLGVRTDIEQILKTVDIAVLSSNWEGFGLVAVEGMAAGKPVIASNVDGLREVVKGAGLLFEKGNVEQLAYKINNLLTDEKIYNDTSKKCIVRADSYDIHIMVHKIFNLYGSLINSENISSRKLQTASLN